jgi:hypothetical protein
MRGLPEQRVTWHLDNWSEWLRDQRSDFGYGYRNRDAIFLTGNSREFDAMVAAADMRCAHAVDTVVADLPLEQNRAVFHKHTAAVIRGRAAENLEANYARARAYLALALPRKGIE